MIKTVSVIVLALVASVALVHPSESASAAPASPPQETSGPIIDSETFPGQCYFIDVEPCSNQGCADTGPTDDECKQRQGSPWTDCNSNPPHVCSNSTRCRQQYGSGQCH